MKSETYRFFLNKHFHSYNYTKKIIARRNGKKEK